MAVQATPYVETALSHSSELFRRELQSGLPFGSAGGVVPATPATSANLTAGVAGCSDLQVSAPASGMSVNISAGQVIVPGSLGSGSGYGMGKGYGYPVITTNGGSAPTIASNAAATQIQLTTQGAYYCYNDNSAGAVNLTISAANPTNPRIDVVIAQVEDSAYSGSNNDWKLAVVTGTAAASPTVPTLPANVVPLALVWVPANASSIVAADIIDLRVSYNRNPFRAQMYRNAAYTNSTTGFQVVPYDTVVYDLAGALTTGTGAQYNVTVPGIYLVSASQTLSAVVSGDRYVGAIYKNGSQYVQADNIQANGTAANSLAGCGLVEATDGDSIAFAVDSVTSASTAYGVGALANSSFTVQLITVV